MLKALKYIFFFCQLFLSAHIFSQNQAAKWYFGDNAGLDFMTSPPSILTGSMSTTAGCASIADGAGNLLFYTDGATIWNQLHQPMANGSGLMGAIGSPQNSLIVKQPGNNSNYYVFTCGWNFSNGLNYSIVDMSLAAGLGSVTVLNTQLLANSYTTKLSATKHCNGTDLWIVTRDGGWNGINTNTNVAFYAYQLSATGVNTTAVVSPANNPWAGAVGVGWSDWGCMKISSNGRKIGMATYGNWNFVNGNNYSYEVYDFNGMTGVVSNSLGLGTWSNNINNWNYSYGCEFSPDGTKFYGSSPWNNGVNNGNGGVYQWDLCAGTSTAIAASEFTVALNPLFNNTGFASMQLAPDGKIYIARWNQTSLSIINNPNGLGAACNFTLNGQPLSPNMSYYGLPNHMSSYLPTSQTLTPFTYTINQAISCLTSSFTAPSSTGFGCAGSGYSVTSWAWNFGDPVSGAANTSTLTTPIHTYPTPGTYSVKLVYSFACGSDSMLIPVTILGASLTINTASITCATLGSATVSAAGGIGPYSYTWMPTAQSASIATGLNPGTYSITVMDNGGNCVFTATTAFSSVVPFTGLVSNSSSIACNGVGTGTASISLAGGSGTQYYYWTDGVTTQTTPTAAGMGAGIHTITVVDAVTSCSVIQFFMITQPPAMNLNVVASSATACAGTSITFTSSNSGGTPGPGPAYTYSWTGGPGTNTKTVAPLLAGSYIYTATSRDGYNCLATQTILATFVPNPTVSVANASICPFETGTLTPSGATTYTWNNSTTNATFTDNPLVNTQYTVVGTALGCTSTPVTTSIVIKPIPSPTITSNSPVCNGQILGMNGSGGTSYVWAGPLSFNSAIQNPSVTPAAPGNSGVYTMTVTAANSCTAGASITLTVHPTPTLSLAGSTVCVNQTLSLTANSFPGAAFLWNGPNAYTSGAQNPLLTNATTGMTGTYTLTVTSLQTCTNTAQTSASVVPMPLPVIVANATAMCSGSALNLSGSGGVSYNWSGPNSFGSSFQNTGIASVSVPSGGIYTLLVTTGPCTITTTQSITVFPLPQPTAFSLPACETASLQLNASGGPASQAPYLFSWTGPQGYTSTVQNPVLMPVSANMAGVYNLVVSDVNNCQASTSTQITVLLNPIVTAVGATVCIGTHAVLEADGAQTYAWSGPGGYTSTLSVAYIPVANSVSPVLYTVIGTGANSCTTSATALLETVALPQPSLVVTPRACLNSTISLKGSGGVTYLWKGPYNFSSSQQNVIKQVSNIEDAGTYTLTVTNSVGCKNYAMAQVIVDPLPEGDLNSSIGNHCIPFCADFNLQLRSSSAVVNTQWQVGNQIFTTDSFRYCITTAGNYLVLGTFTNAVGCANTATFQIQGYPLPQADFVYTPQNPVEGLDNVEFINASRGLQQTQWNWYFVDNGGYRALGRNTNYLFNEAGTFPISLVVKNTWGCKDTVVKTISIEPDFFLYVPNSFTPNNDDRNEGFQPKGSGVVKYNFMIYDRWGELVFQTNDFTKAWDGTYRGQPCKTEVYVWKIIASDKSGRTKNMNGFVTLYR